VAPIDSLRSLMAGQPYSHSTDWWGGAHPRGRQQRVECPE